MRGYMLVRAFSPLRARADVESAWLAIRHRGNPDKGQGWPRLRRHARTANISKDPVARSILDCRRM